VTEEILCNYELHDLFLRCVQGGSNMTGTICV
jgi:hypothetical protein